MVGEEQEPRDAGNAEPPSGQPESLEPPLNPQPAVPAPGGPDKQTQQDVDGPLADREGWGAGRPDWGERLRARDGGRVSEACCQVFSATCHLLLECTTFPLYLSEEEMDALSACTFQSTGGSKGQFIFQRRQFIVQSSDTRLKSQNIHGRSIVA